MDIYFNETEVDKALLDISMDVVFGSIMPDSENQDSVSATPTQPSPSASPFAKRRFLDFFLFFYTILTFLAATKWPQLHDSSDKSNLNYFRAQLLASKQNRPVPERNSGSLRERIKEELDRYCLILFISILKCCHVRFLMLRGCVDHNSNPQLWWREHSQEYPLLSRYYRGHCAFPATSTASERVFNVEGLVVSNSRYIFYQSA